MPFLPVIAGIGAAASAASAVSGLVGGANKGANFQANSGFNQDQQAQAQAQTQHANDMQTNELQNLQNQGGIQNQSDVYNQMKGVANGTGPNPAQAMLAQQTGANTANQAALMAGQRGAGQNVGMIARQAAQQGGANQQSAIGQGATMQANQSLNALGQMGGIAGQQVNELSGVTQNYNQNALQRQGMMAGAGAHANETNASIQKGNQAAQIGAASGLGRDLASSITGLAELAKEKSGIVDTTPLATTAGDGSNMSQMAAHGGMIGPKSKVGQYFKGGQVDYSRGGHVDGKAEVAGDSYRNDKVKALLSPKEIVIPRSITMGNDAANQAAKFVAAILAKNRMSK